MNNRTFPPFDCSALGLLQRDSYEHYYCTPQDAQIFACAGVDGIHYCTVPGFGEMIFAVSPMNPGDCVHPIARSKEDLLRLLLSCADMAALEQCYAWDEEQFQAFLVDFPPTPAQQDVLEAIRREFGLTPIPDAFSYVKQLQAEFDPDRIPYTEDYFDPDMNPAAPVKPGPWNVTFHGDFWNQDGKAGQPLPIGKEFDWGEEHWQIPAAYLCDEGLVLDLCVRIAPEKVRAWIEKWDLERQNRHTFAQEQQIAQENPMQTPFRATIQIGKTLLHRCRGSSTHWISAACLQGKDRNQPETRAVLAHYGLDPDQCWTLHRIALPWNRIPKIRQLTLQLERERTEFSLTRFLTPPAGEKITFTHPLTGVAHTLTVIEDRPGEMDFSRMPEDAMEYPSHYRLLTYTLEPELPAQSIRLCDCAPADEPRFRQVTPAGAVQINEEAACIGIIGGADGPTAVFISHQEPQNAHAACSSPHFAPAPTVQWQLRIYEKTLPDLKIQLL